MLIAGTGPALALLNAGTGRYSLDAGAPTLLYISTDFRAPQPLEIAGELRACQRLPSACRPEITKSRAPSP